MHHRSTDEGGDRVKARQLVLAALAMLTCNWTLAANITVVSTVGVRGMLEQARESFERLGANHLIVQYGTSAVLERQLQEGRSFDVAILTRSMIDDLANRQKIVGTTSATIAKAGMGLAVQAGAVKPSIGTPDALRNALLASSGIAYTKDGQSGAAAARLFELLGITATLTGRIHQDTRPAGGVLAVAEGKTTLGLALMSEIVADPRVELVGPLPGDLQAYVVFAVGMASATKERQACRAFIAFLGTPEVRRKLRNLGMEGG